jgi:hypothetical protein
LIDLFFAGLFGHEVAGIVTYLFRALTGQRKCLQYDVIQAP